MQRRLLGVYNASSNGGISKAQFVLQLASLLGIEPDTVTVCSVLNSNFKARRPLDMRLNSLKLESALNLQLPTIHDQIQMTAHEYQL